MLSIKKHLSHISRWWWTERWKLRDFNMKHRKWRAQFIFPLTNSKLYDNNFPEIFYKMIFETLEKLLEHVRHVGELGWHFSNKFVRETFEFYWQFYFEKQWFTSLCCFIKEHLYLRNFFLFIFKIFQIHSVQRFQNANKVNDMWKSENNLTSTLSFPPHSNRAWNLNLIKFNEWNNSASDSQRKRWKRCWFFKGFALSPVFSGGLFRGRLTQTVES